MSSPEDSKTPLVSKAILGVVVFVCFAGLSSTFYRDGYWAGKEYGTKEVQLQAIKQGFAEWSADEKGNAVFKWKEAK